MPVRSLLLLTVLYESASMSEVFTSKYKIKLRLDVRVKFWLAAIVYPTVQ